MKIDNQQEQLQELLGQGGEVKLVPMFMPAETYRFLLLLSKEHGISVSDVISRSLELFLNYNKDIKQVETDAAKPAAKKPDFIIKRR